MKPTICATLALALALPVAAQETGPTGWATDATYTWSTIDLATAPAADGATASLSEAHLVMTASEPGPMDRLAGRCLLQMRSLGPSYTATGSCALADADGDMIFETVEETDGKGHAVLTGGTGKFEGITGEHDYALTWYASVREGENQGTGSKTGSWRIARP